MNHRIFLVLFMTTVLIIFATAIDYNGPGTYQITKGDTITFNDLTVQVIDIKTNDNNVSWNRDFGREMVYLGTPGLGFYAYVGERVELVKAKYSSEKPIAVIVNSIDINNKKAEVQFIDNYAEGCTERFEKICYKLGIYWADSCGRVGEFIKQCQEGCGKVLGQDARCIEDDSKSCIKLENRVEISFPNGTKDIYENTCAYSSGGIFGVREYYCSGNEVNYITRECPVGCREQACSYCSNGICYDKKQIDPDSSKASKNITAEGTYIIKKGTTINVNYIEATIRKFLGLYLEILNQKYG
jgi:ASC-1-like (ASCH) protein